MKYVMAYTALAAVYLLVYWALGSIPRGRFQSGSVTVMCVTGFLIYYAAFEILALPLKLMGASLTVLAWIWGLVLACMLLFVFLRRRQVLAESAARILQEKKERIYWAILAVLILGFAVFLGFNTNTLSSYDAAYYIGSPVSSVYSDTLGRMNEFTGTLMDAPAHYYLLNTDLLHSALVNKVFSIPVLAERKYSFTIAMVCLFNLALMECADSFFKDERWKKGLFCVFADLVLFYSYSISGVSHYFAYRTYEGKSIISYFYMTVIFMFCLTFYKKGKKEWAGLGLLLSTMSGIAFSNSGLFLVPAAIFCMMAPYICQQVFVKRTGRDIVWLTGILLPSVFWIFLHEIL